MSRRKELWSWGAITLALVLVVSAAIYILWPQLQAHTTVHLGDGIFIARVAKTPEAREKGLSGTRSLREDQGLLFVYDTDEKWPVWMKDMNYAIDIVWLNKDKEVVYIVKNAPPESYPYKTFAPRSNARYILELPAGTVDKKSINVGAKAMFDENNIEGFGL